MPCKCISYIRRTLSAATKDRKSRWISSLALLRFGGQPSGISAGLFTVLFTINATIFSFILLWLDYLTISTSLFSVTAVCKTIQLNSTSEVRAVQRTCYWRAWFALLWRRWEQSGGFIWRCWMRICLIYYCWQPVGRMGWVTRRIVERSR